jgi:hypothetical protein
VGNGLEREKGKNAQREREWYLLLYGIGRDEKA